MEAVVEKGAPIAIYPKGWGYEKWIVNKDEYCGKLLHIIKGKKCSCCLLYTSPSPRDRQKSRMPSSA